MKMSFSQHRHIAANILLRLSFLVLTSSIVFLQPYILRAQTYPIKNDRILAPEVSHFARIAEPGVDAHGDLSLSIPLMTVPGRDGLDFDIVANYRSGIQVTQSASWIGLGWELDVGSITRSPIGGLDRGSMGDGNSEHVDWTYALSNDPPPSRRLDSQPDIYMVNLSGNSTMLYSMTLETNPFLPFTPGAGNPPESGPCFQGQVPTTPYWYFIPAPWRPWKFCYATANPVTVDLQSTGFAPNGNREDFLKFTITTEDGTRYIFSQSTLADAFFPQDDANPPSDIYNRFVSSWRLTAILSPNYSYGLAGEVPNANSPGGWVKITYQTLDEVSPYSPKVVDTIQNTCCNDPHLFAQMTYPYRIDTPTHYAIFETKWRYDRDLAFDPSSPQRKDYNRLLDKIKLYNTATGQLIKEVSFTYLNNGAISLISEPSSQTRSLLSKLALEKIAIKGLQGAARDSLPTYKFSYYDVSLSWYDITTQAQPVMEYQDDFGYYDSNSNGASTIPDTDRPMWSLKEITYPDGGRHFMTYKSDSLNSLSLSYNKYLYSPTAPTYTPNVAGNFQSLRQGGARVKSITTYDGYASSGYVVNFSHGPGRHWSIPEIWFRRNAFPNNLLFSGGERGQSSVTYDWVEKTFPDGSRIKTFYETGDGTPEPQMLFSYVGGTPAKFATIQGNTRWNWGEAKKVQYFAANGVITGNRVKEEIYNWTYRGQKGSPDTLKLATVAPPLLYNSGASSTPEYKLNFTHKQLDSKITKHILAVATGIDSVTMTETYSYNTDGTLMSSKTETSDDGKIRKTEYTYVRELSTVPAFTVDDTMQYRNMRTHIAQTSLKDNANAGYASNITTWRSVNHSGRTKYLPDKEFNWRNSTTAAAIPTFNWGTPAEGSGWILTQTFDQYDQHGNLTSIKNADKVATSIFWDATGTLIDSIQTRPNSTLKPLTTKYAYDPNTFRLTASTDPNNKTTQYKYDPLQRLVEVISPENKTLANHSYFYSRQGAGNNDTFTASDPNSVKSTASTHFEHVRNSDFENGSGPLPDSWNKAEIGAGIGTWDNTEKFSGAKSLKAYIPTAGAGNRVRWDSWYDEKIFFKKTYRMEVWVKTDATYNGLAAFTLWVHDVNHNYLAAETRKMYLANTGNVWKKYTLDFTPGVTADHVYAIYLDFEYNGQGTIWYDRANFYELNIAKIFADGIGRDIQALQREGSGASKSGTLYDFASRVSKVTKPFSAADTSFVLDPIAAANTWYSSTSGNHPAYYFNASSKEFDTDPYAFAETEYYPDPLHRVQNQYFPGTAFSKLGPDKKFVKYKYGANAASELGFAAAGQVLETRVTDENNIQTEIFTDTFGNKVGVRVDSSSASGTEITTKLATAFQYDLLNNLVKIAPPKAFAIANNNTPNWASAFCTNLTYNTLGQVTSRKTPDSGTDSSYYDKKGNLRFFKDAKGAAGNYFIYNKYDNLNRKIEEGTMSPASGNFTPGKADLATEPSAGNTFKIKFQYDSTTYAANATQRNLRGRLDAIEYVDDRWAPTVVKGYLFYSYDNNGNVEWVEQDIPKSSVSDGNGYVVTRIDYSYDALGKATKIYFHRTFPPGGSTDAFYVWYDYDALGRLEKVCSNTADVKPTTANAQYTYWPGGQVRRLALGNNLQGVDYLYNSRDWLTQINNHHLIAGKDPGNDTTNTTGMKVDRFGEVIGYNQQKYIASDPDYTADFAAQFNGNLTWATLNTFGNSTPASLTGWVFKYDNANRLTKSNWGYMTNPTGTDWLASSKYDLSGITYDRNGNDSTMTRNDQNGAATAMTYKYTGGTNKLHQVSGLNGQGANNYTYDANGNMLKDIVKLGSANTITYDYRNLPLQAPIGSSPINYVNFGYDGKGQRISKNNLFYVPGVDGKALAVYDVNGTLLYWNIWGLDLIGQRFWKQ